MRTRFALELAEAEAMVAAAQTHARAHGWAVTTAVVDDAGTPILISRIDEASPASWTTAIEKACSAALTGFSTKALEEMVRERAALLTLSRVAIEGGLPILHKGQKIGGIGVSGVRSDQDAAVAQAGYAAFAQLFP
jgi:glc operon protein GlcG